MNGPTIWRLACGSARCTEKPPPRSRTRGTIIKSSASQVRLSPRTGSCAGIQLISFSRLRGFGAMCRHWSRCLMNVPLRNLAYVCSSSASVFITIGPYWAVPVSWTSATCSSPDSGATRDDQLGRQALHHLVSLIARQASHSGDPSIWPGSRGSNVQDFAFNLETVTRPGWIWPFKFTASPDDTAGEQHAALDQEAHGDCSRVPTACRQAR